MAWGPKEGSKNCLYIHFNYFINFSKIWVENYFIMQNKKTRGYWCCMVLLRFRVLKFYHIKIRDKLGFWTRNFWAWTILVRKLKNYQFFFYICCELNYKRGVNKGYLVSFISWREYHKGIWENNLVHVSKMCNYNL
jgi:hypothetical protein